MRGAALNVMRGTGASRVVRYSGRVGEDSKGIEQGVRYPYRTPRLLGWETPPLPARKLPAAGS